MEKELLDVVSRIEGRLTNTCEVVNLHSKDLKALLTQVKELKTRVDKQDKVLSHIYDVMSKSTTNQQRVNDLFRGIF